MSASAVLFEHTNIIDNQLVGSLLRDTRKLKGLSQEEAASSLNLMTSHIVALEDNRYNSKPEGKYFEIYLNAYAKLLGLDPSVVAGLYERDQPGVGSIGMPFEANKSSGHGLRLLTVIGLLGIALAVNWDGTAALKLNSETSDPKTVLSESFLPRLNAEVAQLTSAVSGFFSSTLLSSAASSKPFAEVSSTGAVANFEDAYAATLGRLERMEAQLNGLLQASQGLFLAKGSVIDEGDEINSASSSEHDAVLDNLEWHASSEAGSSSLAELKFSFTDDSWVEVKDADGEQVFQGEKQANESLSLEGKAPFDVTLGNARAVILSLDGELVPVYVHKHSDHTRMAVSADGVVVTTEDLSAGPLVETIATLETTININNSDTNKPIEVMDESVIAMSPSDQNFQAYRLEVLDTATSEDTLAFSFTQDCWVEVYDKLQQPIIMQARVAGETLVVTGEAPFEVRVGNSRAVSLTLNGTPVRIEQHPEIFSTELIVGRR